MIARQAWSDDSVVERLSNESAQSFLMPDDVVDEELWLTENRRTKQADAKDADINNILSRFNIGDVANNFLASQRRYGDISDAPTYQEALNTKIAADMAFMSLPAKVRKEFDNSIPKFLDFMQNGDPAEMKRLGLLEQRKEPVPVVPEPARPHNNEPVKAPTNSST